MLLSLSFVIAAPLSPGDVDVYLSLPDLGEIRRYDAATGKIEPFASGVVAPFYGQVDEQGNLYVQDALLGAVWRIAPDGSKEGVAAGVHLGIPLSVTIHPTTGELYVSDAQYQHVVKIDPDDGTQTVFSDNSHGLYSIPGGLAFDEAGNLWMTDHGNFWIFKIDPNGVPTPFFDGLAHGIEVPAGIELDRAGNLFVAGYDSNNVARIRVDTGEWEVFADDPLLDEPNDLTMSPDGSGLLCSAAESSALVRIDSMGQVSIVAQDSDLGEFLGAAVPGAYPGCSGSTTSFGTGTAGSGGFVPSLTGIFNPAPGADLAYEIEKLDGGASGLFLWSAGQSTLPIWGGNLYVDFTTIWGLIPFVAGGSGAGNGEVRLQFLHPDDPVLDGISVVVQVLAFDPGVKYRKTMSNALLVSFGSW
jgi:streptogramin lyase